MNSPFAPRSATEVQAEIRRRQRGRAVVMGLLLGAMVVLIFAVTVAKIKAGMVH